MERDGVSPNEVVYGFLIRGYARVGDAVGARQALAEMHAAGVHINSVHYNQVLSAVGRADGAIAGTTLFPRCFFVFFFFVCVWVCWLARPGLAWVTLADGYLYSSDPLCFSPCVVCRSHCGPACNTLAEILSRALFRPTVRSFTIVFGACSTSRDVESMWKAFDMAEKAGVTLGTRVPGRGGGVRGGDP